MPHALSEDDIYRSSTQYRLWSFSPEGLESLRTKTHGLAIERGHRYAGQHGQVNGSADGDHIDFLTAEEELRLVQRYCDVIRVTSDQLKWTINVKATAVQYLKRFYLSNSCMTYPPKEIYKTVAFLACKSESTHMTLSDFAKRISADPEAVLAPEYKIMQALRFTLDVRQPFRGLKGVLMELLNMAEGLMGDVDGVEAEDGRVWQERMLDLPAPAKTNKTLWTPPTAKMEHQHLTDRVQAAYSAARNLLDAPALLTDAYFLYTPSQILLAAMHLADEPLTTFYLSTKLPASSDMRPKILATLASCADMLNSFDASQVLTKDERATLEKKLELCRDPSTKDLVKAFAAMRQDGGGEDGKLDEGVAKKRKLEREKNEKDGDDLFGPSLNGKGG